MAPQTIRPSMMGPSTMHTLLLVLHFYVLGARSALWSSFAVDDQDPAIVYTPKGSWNLAGGGFDAGGNHMLTVDPAASALFTFTGVEVYYLSSLWPYNVTTDLSLDGQLPVTLDLMDHSAPKQTGGSGTVPAHVIRGFVGLENKVHTVKVTMSSESAYGAVVDMFLYIGPPSSESPGLSSGSSSRAQKLVAVLAALLGLSVILCLLLGFTLWRRRNRTPPPPSSGPAPPNSFPNQGPEQQDGAGIRMSEMVPPPAQSSQRYSYSNNFPSNRVGYDEFSSTLAPPLHYPSASTPDTRFSSVLPPSFPQASSNPLMEQMTGSDGEQFDSMPAMVGVGAHTRKLSKLSHSRSESSELGTGKLRKGMTRGEGSSKRTKSTLSMSMADSTVSPTEGKSSAFPWDTGTSQDRKSRAT